MSLKREKGLEETINTPPSPDPTLTDRITDLESQVNTLEQQKQNNEGELQRLIDQQNEKNEDIVQKNKQIGDINRAFANQTDELNNHKKKLQEVRKANSTLIGNIESLEKTNSGYKETLDNYENEYTKIKDEHEKLSSIYQDFLKNSKNNSLRNAVKRLEEQITGVEDVWEEAVQHDEDFKKAEAFGIV